MNGALVIDTRQGGDWSLDLLFAGLVENIGFDNVWDYPFHKKHRLGDNFRTGDNVVDWGLERMSLGYTTHHNLLCGPLTKDDVCYLVDSGKIDAVFLDEREESFIEFCKLGLQARDVRVIVVAGHDKFWNTSPQKMKMMYGRNLKLVFASNWHPSYDQCEFVRKYDWSANFDHLWDSSKRESLNENKIYDICFMGYNSHPHRNAYVDHVLKTYGGLNNKIIFEREPNTAKMFVNKEEYFSAMAQSKICLNLRGAAEDGKTLRFFEIPYVGSYMLTERTSFTDNLVHKFEDGVHCGMFSNLSELDEKIRDMLDHPIHREGIARRGHEYLLSNHGVKFRVKEMLEVIDGQE